jgi:radical SAM protein with 4Fe4S-binding SPASM domain
VQLTVAMGRAADNPELLLQPYQLLELMPLLAELFWAGVERGMLLQPGNNIGYFGPYESVWRGGGDDRVHWSSCNAGENTMGVEADGTIKGCPSLPTVGYAGGNVRDLTLEDIWRNTPELNFNLTRAGEELWGYCGGCYYADSCRGGCTWLSHSLFGRPGNNPFCHHRALELSARGLRERIVPAAPAPGLSFDHGRFDLLLETSDGRPVSSAPTSNLVQIGRAAKRTSKTAEASPKAARGASAERPNLVLCRACDRHVKSGTRACPFCGADVKASARKYRRRLRAAQDACQQLLELLPSD